MIIKSVVVSSKSPSEIAVGISKMVFANIDDIFKSLGKFKETSKKRKNIIEIINSIKPIFGFDFVKFKLNNFV